MNTKIPKFYICKYGAFYEGEEVKNYCTSGENYYYSKNVIIEKFIVHYYDYVPTIYFKFREIEHKSKTFTLPCEGYLGIYYRKIGR